MTVNPANFKRFKPGARKRPGLVELASHSSMAFASGLVRTAVGLGLGMNRDAQIGGGVADFIRGGYRTGKVISNLMVDVSASNTKLKDRATRILCALSKLPYDQARAALEKNNWSIKSVWKKLQASRK